MKSLSLILVIFALGQKLYADTLATNYEKAVKELVAIQSSNQNLVEAISLGMNDQKMEIKGIKIALAGATVPKLVVASHHGNETLSVGLALQFAKDLIAVLKNPNHPQYALLKDSVFYVIPVLNITGYNSSRREERDSKNISRDPNRDYPDPCIEKVDFHLSSTKHLATFMRQKQISAAVTIHGYVGSFTYPWGIFTDNDHTQDHATYSSLGEESVTHNHYVTGTHAEIVYPAAGSFEDWAYFELGTWTMLMEMDYGANILNDSKSMLTFFAKAPKSRSLKNQHLGACTERQLDRLFDGVTPIGRP